MRAENSDKREGREEVGDEGKVKRGLGSLVSLKAARADNPDGYDLSSIWRYRALYWPCYLVRMCAIF